MAYVQQLENKNQFVIFSKDGDEIITTFQSYDSVCAVVTTKNNVDFLTLGLHWDYSKTTLKHLYLFLYQYCYDVYEQIENSTNKRKAIQKMIDNGDIKYEEGLK